jgi:hypothetical protein
VNFRFSDKEKYLTAAEQKHLDEFFAFEPQCKKVYQNAKGEKRLPLMVKRPKGCIAPDTVWGPRIDGARWYHTPLATLNDKVAGIYYRDPDTGKTDSCTSREWLKWLGKEWTNEDKPKPKRTATDNYVESQKKSIASGNIRSVSAEEFDRIAEKEDAKWHNTIAERSSGGTSRTKGSTKKSGE